MKSIKLLLAICIFSFIGFTSCEKESIAKEEVIHESYLSKKNKLHAQYNLILEDVKKRVKSGDIQLDDNNLLYRGIVCSKDFGNGLTITMYESEGFFYTEWTNQSGEVIGDREYHFAFSVPLHCITMALA